MELSTKLFRRRCYRWSVVCFLMYFLFLNALASLVIAGPEGSQVVNGQVTIQQSGNNTVITASDKAIINYSSFDIAQPETVRFIQPGSNASVLNRILSANPTNINGTLLANGRVFFVNPAGVYIGNGARINVNQLVASGLNISNADFINGRYNFVGGNGAVINNGDISAQQVYLIGIQVTNSGNISCPAGYVVMAAGDRVFLGEPGSDIVLDVEGTSLSESAALGVGVLNEGTVEAAGGIIALAAAGDIYSQAISNVGSLSTSVDTGKAGQIKLTAAGGEVVNTGTIEASGSEGGQVAIEAKRVGQFGTIHADGITGNGGTVDLLAGEVVALSSDSLTTANAGLNGNGGDVTVFSPDTALFWPDATIEAKGGTVSGDGGFVEVSGLEHVEVFGLVDTSANNGDNGTFLIDPTNITITGADNAGAWSGGNTGTWTPSGTGSVADVDTGLANGNVIVTTNFNAGEAGDITVGGAITASANGNSLTLQAANDILLNTGIDMSAGTGNLTLTADWGDGDVASDGAGAITDGGGTITMNGSGDLTMTAGDGIGASGNPIETVGLTDIAATTQTGGIFINNTGSGNINVTSVGGTNGLTTTTSGNISVTNSAGNITTAQPVTAAGTGTITLDATTITIDGTGDIDSGSGLITLLADGDIDLNTGGTVGAATTGAITITADRDNSGAGTLTTDAAIGNGSAAGDVTITADDIDLQANTTVTGTGGLTLQPSLAATSIGVAGGAGDFGLSTAEIGYLTDGFSSITIGRSDSTGGVTINAVTFNDPVTIQTPSGGSIAVDGQITGSGDASITLDGSGATTTLSDDIVTAGNPINISDIVEIDQNQDVLLDTTNGGAVSTGAGVTIQGALNGDIATANGGESLTIRAGSAGAIQLQSTVGATQALDSLTITDSASTTITGTTNVGTFTITDTTGTVAFNGGLTAGTLTTAAQSYNVAINAGGTITTDTIFLNNGTVTLGNEASDSITFTGGLDTAGNPSGTNLAGIVATTNNQMDLGAVTMTANAALTSGNAAINVASITDGASSYSLDVGDGSQTGAITFSGNATINDLDTFASGYDIAVEGSSNTIDTDTGFLNTGTVTLGNGATDSITFTGGLATTGNASNPSLVNIGGTVITTDTQMDLGGITLTANSELDTGTAATSIMNVGAVTGAGFDLTLDSGLNAAADITVASTDNVGTLTIRESGGTTFSGTVGAATITITDTADAAAVSFTDNLTVGTGMSVAANGAYNVSITGTTNSIAGNTSFLNTGTVTLGDSAGDTTTFTGGVTATSPSALNIAGTVATTNTQMNLGDTTITADSTLKSGSGVINVASITDGASSFSLDAGDGSQTGAITFSGNATINDLDTFASGYNVAFQGASNTIDTDTTFLNTGTVTLGNGAGDSLTFTGGLDTTSGSGTSIAGTVATTAQDIDLGATTLTSNSTLNTGAGAGNITFQNTLDGTTDLAEDLTLTAGTANTDFDATVGGIHDLGDVTINSATNVTIDSAFNANNISITASNTTANNITAAVDLTLNSTTTVANGAILSAGNDLNVGPASLTGDGALTLIATGGGISGSGTIQANDGVGTQGDLTLRQSDSLNLATFTFGNQSTTDLTAQSYNGGVTIDKTKPANAADKWQSITATAANNIELQGTDDIKLGGNLTSASGGVSIISDDGTVITVGDTILDNVTITGNPAAGGGVDLDPAMPGSGEAAIVIRTKEDLTLGSNVELIANGQYDPQQNDDRYAVGFEDSISGGGDQIDVAIYLRSHRTDAVGEPIGNVTVNSKVTMDNKGTMVIDAGEKVTFGGKFNESVFNQTHRLEVVSRRSNDLNEVMRYGRLPYANNPEAIRDWFNETTGYFAGAYVLRGVKTLLAEVLALTNPVPLVPPRPLEPEFRGKVEGPDTEALANLLSELGIGVQPYMTEAYANSLSTDLRLYKAAEKLQKLMPVLEDADGTRIAGLRKVVAQFFPTLDMLSEEQMDSFNKVLESHKGDGTDFDLAGQCILALREYVNILSTEIGWPVEKSVEFVMGRYVPRLTENDEIRIAVIQMHIQK